MVSIYATMELRWAALLVAAQFLISHTAAQVPSVWKPLDVVTYFCARWYHQGKRIHHFHERLSTDKDSCGQE
jgi:hypothetical protein